VKLGSKEVCGAGIYLGEYTGIVKVNNEDDLETTNPNYQAFLVKGLLVDATDSTNVLKYLNHSCVPNAELVRCYSEDGEPIIRLFSLKRIEPFTWIDISYGDKEFANGFFLNGKCLCTFCN